MSYCRFYLPTVLILQLIITSELTVLQWLMIEVTYVPCLLEEWSPLLGSDLAFFFLLAVMTDLLCV